MPPTPTAYGRYGLAFGYPVGHSKRTTFHLDRQSCGVVIFSYDLLPDWVYLFTVWLSRANSRYSQFFVNQNFARVYLVGHYFAYDTL